MTLKELLEEVEKRKDGHLLAREGLGETIDYYAKDLMPELARRLKKAVNTMRTTKPNHAHTWGGMQFNGYGGGPCPSDCPRKIVADALREIEEPKPKYPVVRNATQSCQNCARRFMMRAEKSHGWYCKSCGVFLPDDCVQ